MPPLHSRRRSEFYWGTPVCKGKQKLGFPFPFFPPRDLAFSPTDSVFSPWLRVLGRSFLPGKPQVFSPKPERSQGRKRKPNLKGKNQICWGKSQISWGEKGKGKTQHTSVGEEDPNQSGNDANLKENNRIVGRKNSNRRRGQLPRERSDDANYVAQPGEAPAW